MLVTTCLHVRSLWYDYAWFEITRATPMASVHQYNHVTPAKTFGNYIVIFVPGNWCKYWLLHLEGTIPGRAPPEEQTAMQNAFSTIQENGPRHYTDWMSSTSSRCVGVTQLYESNLVSWRYYWCKHWLLSLPHTPQGIAPGNTGLKELTTMQEGFHYA